MQLRDESLISILPNGQDKRKTRGSFIKINANKEGRGLIQGDKQVCVGDDVMFATQLEREKSSNSEES